LTNVSDQSTAKVHRFTIDFAREMVKLIKKCKYDFKMSEIIMYDIAMFRLMEEFKGLDWNNTVKVDHFIDELLKDVYKIQDKHVDVKIRNVPKKKRAK
jgi:hypothetical protein